MVSIILNIMNQVSISKAIINKLVNSRGDNKTQNKQKF